ncbi:MAG: hypothetical protein KAR15_03775, partial [Desulfobacterales bacterium]|nr:hypothetical protein [Desulfobacterales bacterium]
KTQPFGQRVAHGLLVLSIASGLAVQIGVLEGTIMALREIDKWKFTKPVFIGDTIGVEIEILDKRATRKPDRGIVTFRHRVINQKDELVMEYTVKRMIRRKSAGG